MATSCFYTDLFQIYRKNRLADFRQNLADFRFDVDIFLDTGSASGVI